MICRKHNQKTRRNPPVSAVSHTGIIVGVLMAGALVVLTSCSHQLSMLQLGANTDPNKNKPAINTARNTTALAQAATGGQKTTKTASQQLLPGQAPLQNRPVSYNLSSSYISKDNQGAPFDWRALHNPIAKQDAMAAANTADGLFLHAYDPLNRLESRNQGAAHQARLDGVLGHDPFADRTGLQIDYQKSYVSEGALGDLDISLSPQASMAVGPEGSATRLGALVKIGDNLNQPRKDKANWYLFVGGGAEALTYEPGGQGSLVDGLRLEEKTLVGDGQAGIAVRVGRANLSLAYVRRETDVYSRVGQLNTEDVENFAALTLTFGR